MMFCRSRESRRRLVWGLTAVTLLLVSAVTINAAAGKKTLRIYVPCGTVGPISQALDSYNSANPQLEMQQVVDKGKPLMQRLKKGDACDIYIGRPEEVQSLVKQQLLDSKSQTPIAAQILCLVVPADNPAGIKSLKDITSPRLKSIAIAPADSHPGKYTLQALKRLKLEGKIKAKQVVPPNADSLAMMVGKGDVQAAILFLSCVQVGTDAKGKPISTKRIRIIENLPASSHDQIMLSAAVVKKSKNGAESRRLVKFLGTKQAQQYFLGNGFRAPAKKPKR